MGELDVIARLVTDLARLSGVSEAVIRQRYGLAGTDGVSIAPGPVSADDRARIAPVPEPEIAGWYSTDGWEHRDDAHRVTFEGGAA